MHLFTFAIVKGLMKIKIILEKLKERLNYNKNAEYFLYILAQSLTLSHSGFENFQAQTHSTKS